MQPEGRTAELQVFETYGKTGQHPPEVVMQYRQFTEQKRRNTKFHFTGKHNIRGTKECISAKGLPQTRGIWLFINEPKQSSKHSECELGKAQ
jgi:hypothetical protein